MLALSSAPLRKPLLGVALTVGRTCALISLPHHTNGGVNLQGRGRGCIRPIARLARSARPDTMIRPSFARLLISNVFCPPSTAGLLELKPDGEPPLPNLPPGGRGNKCVFCYYSGAVERAVSSVLEVYIEVSCHFIDLAGGAGLSC